MLSRFNICACAAVWLALSSSAGAQEKPFEPVVGQAGKDVVWVPTPAALVEKMLDLAQVTSKDYVIDLGSGDGRNVIAAAKRGARALGVEYNPDMVALSTKNATSAGVAGKATFVRGDMYEADISKATVMALFLLPSNMLQLREKFLALRPGTRIVANTFGIEGWEPDRREVLAECEQWCTALLWIVPARVEGTWRMDAGDLILDQEYQIVTGALAGKPVVDGRLNGDEIAFSMGDAKYAGRVRADVMEGTVTTGGTKTRWRARRR
jgi:SAM-dependent methyltransferase